MKFNGLLIFYKLLVIMLVIGQTINDYVSRLHNKEWMFI